MKRLFFITCATIVVSFFISTVYIPKAIVVWDEATHMDIAYTMYTFLRAGDLRSYMDSILHQTGYPPLMPIVSSFIFLFTGFSIDTARMVNLVWFVTSSVLLYLLGSLIAPLVGTIASLFFITSPLIILLSSLFMREGLGITMTLASVYVYLLARKKGTAGWYAGSGLVVFLAIMAKYNLGFIVTLAIALEAIIALFSAHDKKQFLRHHFILLAIIGMLFLLWMLYPSDKVPGLVRFLSDPIQYSVGAPSMLMYLTYYPLAVLYVYTVSLEIGIILLVSYVVAIRFLHNPALRLMWIVVLINYVLATIHLNNVQERYIATSVPLLFCIGAFVIVYFVTHIPWRKHFVKILYGVVFIILGSMVAHDMSNLPHYVYTISTHTFRTPLFNQTSYEDTMFRFDRAAWEKPLPGLNDQSPQDVMTFIMRSVDPNKPIWIDGYFNELSPGYFHLMKELQKEKGRAVFDTYTSYTVTIEVLPGSKFYTYDYTFQNAWQIPNIRARQKDPHLAKIKEKLFDRLGIRVVIYGT